MDAGSMLTKNPHGSKGCLSCREARQCDPLSYVASSSSVSRESLQLSLILSLFFE